MLILDIIKRGRGKMVKYRGVDCPVLWTENETEDLGMFQNKDGKWERKFARHVAFAYDYLGDKQTFRSCWPKPENNDLKDYAASS